MITTAFAVLLATAPDSIAGLCLEGRDPVALCRGIDVIGLPKYQETYGVFSYWFDSEENRRTFRRDPERYAAQWGGACGNMGPLSGRGLGSLFQVYEGKIWVFASKQCKAAFNSDPAAFQDSADPIWNPKPDEAKEGSKLLAKVVQAHGGAAVDRIQRYVWVFRTAWQSEGREKESFRALGYERRLGYVLSEYGESFNATNFSRSDGAWCHGTGATYSLGSGEREYLKRLIIRNPILLLVNRNEPGFRVGTAAIECDEDDYGLRIWHAGVDVTFVIDGKTSRIEAVHGRERIGGPVQQVARVLGDYRQVSGVWVPFAADIWYGSLTEPRKSTVHAVRINDQADARFFAKPK